MHGVGGDALGGMDGAGIAETGRGRAHSQSGSRTVAGCGCAGRSGHRCRPMRVMVHRSPFFTQSVAESRSRRSLLRVMITSPTLARFPRPDALRCRPGVIETMRAGTAVEFGDELAGRGEHDRVESGSSVRNPSSESILGGLGEITNMNTAMIEIEAECAGIAFPQGERGLCFGRVGEAM